MANLLSNSLSGLLAFQRALATTSHNISNSTTPGYNRQRVELGTRIPQQYGGAWIGAGVNLISVTRVVESARQASVRTNSTDFYRLDTFAELAGRIDNLLADKTAGLSPAMQGVFDAIQTVSNDPASQTSRQVLLDEGNNLVSRFKFLEGRLNELERDISQRLKVQVAEINEYAQGIAQLNYEIAKATGNAGGVPPNDLLDKRDHLLLQLSERVATQVVIEDDGSMNVSIGKGQPLVVGNTANKLTITMNAYDKSRPEVSFVGTHSTINITDSMTGGTMGGLLEFRHTMLDTTRQQLGQLAATIALDFNRQHSLGMRFDTNPPQLGGNFFTVATPRVLPHESNSASLTGSPTVEFDLDNLGQLKGADYRLSFDGTDWTLRRLSDGQSWTAAAGDTFSVDGLTIDTSTITGMQDGDSFLLQPTRDVVDQLSMAIDRPEQIAAASPVITGEATDSTGQSINTGSGRIGTALVSDATGLPLDVDEPIRLIFDGTGAFTVEQNGVTLGTIAYDPVADVDGKTVTLPGYPGISFTLAGSPHAGDEFVIASNQNGRGDNSNMLQLGLLQDKAGMVNGNATYQEFYSGLVGDVGASTMRVNINRDAHEVLLNQSIASHEAVSGVNLDEEAANLMRYMQAYQAAAQLISVADSLFETLLTAVRR